MGGWVANSAHVGAAGSALSAVCSTGRAEASGEVWGPGGTGVGARGLWRGPARARVQYARAEQNLCHGGQPREKSSLWEQMREILSPRQMREIFRPCAPILPTHVGSVCSGRTALVLLVLRAAGVLANCKVVRVAVHGRAPSTRSQDPCACHTPPPLIRQSGPAGVLVKSQRAAPARMIGPNACATRRGPQNQLCERTCAQRERRRSALCVRERACASRLAGDNLRVVSRAASGRKRERAG